ncbi:sensor histidine kinase [Altererythrobacter sp. Root672]|uniref:sensor histidine kinase n=1 Tax=Altererythrobacter sp. Root672 TaxID=1736584 RepID=UPI0006F791CD|nr:sensor histidine kinase [Altererythrobacter sp. Root672]KRA84004.1 hypothetical protein ASD76_08370 [Altererythrobacter sp. Root672]
MASSEDPRAAKRSETTVDVLPPLPDLHGTLAALEHMVLERDQRIALLELHQQETDHRVKNSLQLVASLAYAPIRSSHEIDLKLLAADVAERIGLIARIHDLLCRRRAGSVDLGDLLIQLCGKTARLLDSSTSPVIQVDTVGCDLPPQSATAMALIVHELILNSFKHADSEGRRTRVAVRLRQSSEEAISVVVEDDGGGSPPPIDAVTPGMGMVLVRKIARSVGATVRGQATGAGCRFTIELPVAEDAVAAKASPY